MDTWGPANWALMIPITAIVGGFAYVIVATIMKSRVRELEIRQRIALVERGLVPPPEADPRGFEHAMRALDVAATKNEPVARASRHRRAGIILIGLGFGLMLLIGLAGDSPHEAVGVGGFLVFVGLAFVANGWFEGRQRSMYFHDVTTPQVPPGPPAPNRSE